MLDHHPTPETKARLCLFCGNTAGSPEHIWSTWMHKYFKRGAHEKSLETNYRESVRNRYAPEHRVMYRHPVNRKVKAVCKTCNEVWMSKLETAAKPYISPMIQGKHIFLDQSAQQIITQWLTLKMMVWEQTDPRSTVTTRDETLAFAKDRSLPLHIDIWLLRAETAGTHITRAASSFFIDGKVSEAERDIANTHTVLFTAGQLLAFYVHCRLPELKLGEFRKMDAKRLYPHSALLTWPPMRKQGPAAIGQIGGSLMEFMALPNVNRF